jgi:hypothetical protein
MPAAAEQGEASAAHVGCCHYAAAAAAAAAAGGVTLQLPLLLQRQVPGTMQQQQLD